MKSSATAVVPPSSFLPGHPSSAQPSPSSPAAPAFGWESAYASSPLPFLALADLHHPSSTCSAVPAAAAAYSATSADEPTLPSVDSRTAAHPAEVVQWPSCPVQPPTLAAAAAAVRAVVEEAAAAVGESLECRWASFQESSNTRHGTAEIHHKSADNAAVAAQSPPELAAGPAAAPEHDPGYLALGPAPLPHSACAGPPSVVEPAAAEV